MDRDDQVTLEALTRCFRDSLSEEKEIREILSAVGMNDPKRSLRDCVLRACEEIVSLQLKLERP